jgi:hypothetical protein
VRAFAAQHRASSIELVRFVLFNASTLATFERACASVPE